MLCSSCGHENRAGRRFCVHCGAGVELACPSCGASSEPGERFCGECGKNLVGFPKTSATGDPRAYTPKHLVEKILASRSALEGERKHVTVLFADVKGSMDLAEQIDAEEWHRIMDRFFAILSEGVHRFEGTINQFTGDGIMALFGAPIAHEDHAQRACYAALHLQQELRRYADEMRLEHALNFSVRMGLNSGEVVVGKIGDDLRMDYTAQGHTVGLAARMEQIAEAGKALLTEHTAKLVSGYFTLRGLGASRVKGMSDPLQVFELEGVGRVRGRLDVSRARGFTKFVGRSHEMAALEAALDRAVAGSGQVVGVVADPGLGKSRLCYEFAERCRAREIPVYEAHGVAHGKAIPLLPILEHLRGYFGITEQDTARGARDKIAGRMVLLDETLAEGLPIMFDFLGVPDPERPTPPLGPEARQRQFLAVIRRLGRARSAREPAVHLFEDPTLLRSGERGVHRKPGRGLAWQSDARAAELPPRVPRLVDAAVPLSAASAAPARPRSDRGTSRRSARHGFIARALDRADSGANGRQSLLHRGDRPVVGGNGGPARDEGRAPPGEVRRRSRLARDRAERPGGADRPTARAGKAAAANGVGDREELLGADTPACHGSR